ncbi:MAG: arginine-tRNA-protein transferase [Haliscomenobacter sp.]|nr:arginine-tRNA-protein transferase [Haliscomenobacter sp.]MBK7475496.1 arginine-tRNA-protein transferase [Haliscomenobacter sp.]MBK8878792.1 arginine-tRNA-protein transferase [Haliscomenobacter sp.]
MFASKNYPEGLNAEALDTYLANGWYRMGQAIFTTHFLCFGTEFYSAIWIRLPLETHRFSKSISKILRKNLAQFRCEFRPARLDAEKEKLYRIYREHFSGMLAPSLDEALMEGEAQNIYDTVEFAVYDGSELVAVSFFDLGSESVSSIMGIYHPEYRKYSLGLFTMLMEIVYAQKNNYRFFYPGYIIPGYPRFDYKLRIGEVEYLDLRGNEWLPFRNLPEEEIPMSKMKIRLKSLSAELKARGTEHFIYYYPLFEANLFGFWRVPFFDYPILLYLKGHGSGSSHYLVIFDPRTSLYQLLICSNFDEVQFFFRDAFLTDMTNDQFFLDLILIDQVLETATDYKSIAEVIQSL